MIEIEELTKSYKDYTFDKLGLKNSREGKMPQLGQGEEVNTLNISV
ncbi:hypothetical protein LMG8526HA_00370 [Lactococcus lactis]|nr:hypothetical protein [Lactococcus lactis]MDU0399524.1 hypothetical protein [Lactococcus lactis]